MKKIIWTENIDTSEEIENLKKEYPDIYEDYSENDMYSVVWEENLHWLEDERMNLSGIKLPGNILMLVSLGLWNGRKCGYHEMETNEVSAILQSYLRSESYSEFYSNGYDICATESHHDGTNFYTFRYIKPGVNIDRLLNKILDEEEVSRSMLNYYTGSLVPYVHPVYGWEVPVCFKSAERKVG